MKKVLILCGLLFVLLGSAHAQKGKQAIGFGLSYGNRKYRVGYQVSVQYYQSYPYRAVFQLFLRE